MAAQLAEQLLQIGQRDLLALADGRQGDRAIVLAQGQIDHGGNRKTAFGSETHRKLLKFRLVRCRNAEGFSLKTGLGTVSAPYSDTGTWTRWSPWFILGFIS
ncbi:hypothetical protein Acidovoranil_08320 [Acidovorax sp. FG27]